MPPGTLLLLILLPPLVTAAGVDVRTFCTAVSGTVAVDPDVGGGGVGVGEGDALEEAPEAGAVVG